MTNPLRALLPVIVCAALLAPAPRPPVPLRAGAARADITPDGPLALEGYQDPETRISTGVHDRLYARALAFASGHKRVVVLSCDLGTFMFAPYFVRLIGDRWGLQADEILLCATHTHSGPQLSLNPSYPHPGNSRYTSALERTLVDLTGRALRALAPARIAVGRAQTDVAASRRRIGADGRVEMAPNRDGIADPEVLALALSRPAGRPFAVLFACASHSRSLRRANTLVSGDVLGIAEQGLEKRDAGLVAAALAGASGDIDPITVVDSFDTADGATPPTVVLGTRLGEDAWRAARQASVIPMTAGIRTASARVQLPAKTAGPTRWVTVTVVTIADLALVGLDCEASVEIGLDIKRASPFAATFVITHCNGWVGYLPTARQHEEGGYEVARTGFAPEAAGLLVKETVALLARLHVP